MIALRRTAVGALAAAALYALFATTNAAQVLAFAAIYVVVAWANLF